MGTYDELYCVCPRCSNELYRQLRICEFPFFRKWLEGSPAPTDIDPEYKRLVLKQKWDRCDKCGAALVIDFTSGFIKVYDWDEKEKLEDPTEDYFNAFHTHLFIHNNIREITNIVQISEMLQDDDLLWLCPAVPDNLMLGDYK
jgi:hypothetical protein